MLAGYMLIYSESAEFFFLQPSWVSFIFSAIVFIKMQFALVLFMNKNVMVLFY